MTHKSIVRIFTVIQKSLDIIYYVMIPLEILLLVVEAVEALVSPYYIEAWWRNVGININYSSNSVLGSIGAGIIFVCIFLKIVLAVVIEKTKTASLMINHV